MLCIQFLHCLVVEIEVIDCKGDYRIQFLSRAHPVRYAFAEIPDGIFAQVPASSRAVPGGGFSGELAHKAVVLNSFEGEFVGRLVPFAEGTDIDKLSRRYLVVHVLGLSR